MLGRGFTGRLMGTVRDREGLTYGIGAGVGEDSIADGEWCLSASFAPALLERGWTSTRRVTRQHGGSDGVTDAEWAPASKGSSAATRVGLSTAAGSPGMILTAVQRGYDLTWLDGYPQAIAA